jgi:hypothetical protein
VTPDGLPGACSLLSHSVVQVRYAVALDDLGAVEEQQGWTCRINGDELPEWIPPLWIDQQQRPKSTHASDASRPNGSRNVGDDYPTPHEQPC